MTLSVNIFWTFNASAVVARKNMRELIIGLRTVFLIPFRMTNVSSQGIYVSMCSFSKAFSMSKTLL